MPVPKEILALIDASKATGEGDYVEKLPTLGREEFPDDVELGILANYSEYGVRLRELLREAGLSKGQRAGVNRILGNAERIGDYNLTLGDIRELSLEDLSALSTHFSYGKSQPRSLLILKTLCGTKQEENL